jgi:cyclase
MAKNPQGERSGSPPPRVEEVADHVFAYIQPHGGWWVNNTGFVASASEVLAIDSCATEKRTRAFVESIETVAGRVPHTLINTHNHGDHTNGNCLLAGATIVGHRLCRQEMLATGITKPDGVFDHVEWGQLEPFPPFVVFDEGLDVYVGDLLVELRHIGTAAHTTNDVVAWIPEHRVLFAGDLVFNGGTPFVLMGSVAGSLLALDRIVEFGAEKIVPGHGDVCTNEDLDMSGEYLRFLQRAAHDAKEVGLSPLEAARTADLESEGFDHLLEPERLAGNLRRALAEANGAKPGEPLDLVAAFADMVALNGGRPLSCHA